VEEPAESSSNNMVILNDAYMAQQEGAMPEKQSEKIMLGTLVGTSPNAGLMSKLLNYRSVYLS
jgi:hypothetical protein